MIRISIDGSDGAELLLDYQQGVVFTVLLADKTQIDFGLEPHEWEVLLAFLDKQKEVEKSFIETAVSQEVSA